MEKTIRLETPTSHQPDEERRRGREPLKRKRPLTWPSSWTSLPEDVQDVWQNEGIEDVTDPQTLYMSVHELHGHLGEKGISTTHCEKAAAHWADTARAVATARSSGGPAREEELREPPPTTTIVATKKRCSKPKFINGPGLFEQQWRAKEEMKATWAAQRQGMQPAASMRLEEVWDICTRAGSSSTVHREVTGEELDILRGLFLQPIKRYADSLAGRLATWRRWEKWCENHEARDAKSAFRPTDITMGRYLLEIAPTGATAATQAMAGLRWWATHLGIDLRSALQPPHPGLPPEEAWAYHDASGGHAAHSHRPAQNHCREPGHQRHLR